jgi:hypothetical protein
MKLDDGIIQQEAKLFNSVKKEKKDFFVFCSTMKPSGRMQFFLFFWEVES